MKRRPILNFFDISSDVEELPKNELFKLKGGYSDVDWEEELDPVDVFPPDVDPGEDEGGDDWINDDDGNDYDDDYFNDIIGEGGGGGANNGGSNNSQDPDYNNTEVRIADGTIINHENGVLFRGDDGRIIYFKGVNVAKNSFDGDSAYQLNGKIYIGEAWRNNGFNLNILAHEYGHYLQQQQYGTDTYLANVALPSVISAAFDPSNHDAQWYEENATIRGEAYLNEYATTP